MQLFIQRHTGGQRSAYRKTMSILRGGIETSLYATGDQAPQTKIKYNRTLVQPHTLF